jgi:hypothetical protein
MLFAQLRRRPRSHALDGYIQRIPAQHVHLNLTRPAHHLPGRQSRELLVSAPRFGGEFAHRSDVE